MFEDWKSPSVDSKMCKIPFPLRENYCPVIVILSAVDMNKSNKWFLATNFQASGKFIIEVDGSSVPVHVYVCTQLLKYKSLK